jgi:hypothetical protein
LDFVSCGRKSGRSVVSQSEKMMMINNVLVLNNQATKALAGNSENETWLMVIC